VQSRLVLPTRTPLEGIARSRTFAAALLFFSLAPVRARNPQTPTTAEPSHAVAKSGESRVAGEPASESLHNEYRIGTNDVIEISVFEAPELNGKLRVPANGELSLPLVGKIQAGGLTARELEGQLEERLRGFLKDPHVGVFVSAVESHAISVLGAVKKPGVFQVRGARSLLEMLALAEGLADDAGDSVLVMRGAGLPASDGAMADAAHRDSAPGDIESSTARIALNQLLKTEDAELNITVYPGDIVKVVKAGVVYVVGEVKRPGGFVLKNDERMTVLKAIALAEGLTATSAKGSARIIRSSPSDRQREEVPINLGKILAGKAPDPQLNAADIVFVPNSTGKSAAYKGSEAAISAVTSLLIFRW
jgi:polysaccharide biosynthesis/export protein